MPQARTTARARVRMDSLCNGVRDMVASCVVDER